jgi:hypothetical protein
MFDIKKLATSLNFSHLVSKCCGKNYAKCGEYIGVNMRLLPSKKTQSYSKYLPKQQQKKTISSEALCFPVAIKNKCTS